jgi:UDP-glucose 4-epimerase
MAHFLVTGGAGFIGSHLVNALLDQGHAVRVLGDLSSGNRENLPAGTEFMLGDVTDTGTVEQAFEGVDACYHLAAIASVLRSSCEWLRTHEVNLTGTINILDQARRLGQRREIPVIYASSAAVYGNAGIVPIVEDGPVAPLSAYSADKRACELHAFIPRSPYSGVIALFADRLARGEPVEIFGEGDQVRDFTYIGDAVCALTRALSVANTSAPLFNVCTGEGTTVRTLAEIMAALCRTELVTCHRPARRGDVRVSIGDPRRAEEQLGVRARTRLREGLALTIRRDAIESPTDWR